MQNSPQPSFRTALQGAAVGELIGSGYLRRCQGLQSSIPNLAAEGQGLTPALSLPWTAQIVDRGEIGLAVLEPIPRNLKIPYPFSDSERSMTVSSAVLVAFPFLMLFHDQPEVYGQYRDGLLRGATPEVGIVLDGMRWAIAACLESPSRFDPEKLVTWLQDFPPEDMSNLPWQTALCSVQTLIQQQSGVIQASRSLSRLPLALKPLAVALYCFLSTPQDFRLSVLRAVELMPEMGSLTCALVGILSGAYNRYGSIPTAWALALEDDSRTALNQRLQILAHRLWTVWTGKDQPMRPLERDLEEPLVVFPRRLTRNETTQPGSFDII